MDTPVGSGGSWPDGAFFTMDAVGRALARVPLTRWILTRLSGLCLVLLCGSVICLILSWTFVPTMGATGFWFVYLPIGSCAGGMLHVTFKIKRSAKQWNALRTSRGAPAPRKYRRTL
jgi:hypothetical protein